MHAFDVDLSNNSSRLDVDELFGKVSNAKLSLGDNNLVVIDEGNGSFVVRNNGVAADFSASLTVNSQDVESRGVFSAKVNYTGKSININKGIGNTSFTLNLDDSLDKIIEGSGVKFVVGSQELEGNFDLIQENGLVRLSMEGASVVVGDDSNDYIKVGNTCIFDPCT